MIFQLSLTYHYLSRGVISLSVRRLKNGSTCKCHKNSDHKVFLEHTDHEAATNKDNCQCPIRIKVVAIMEKMLESTLRLK